MGGGRSLRAESDFGGVNFYISVTSISLPNFTASLWSLDHYVGFLGGGGVNENMVIGILIDETTMRLAFAP